MMRASNNAAPLRPKRGLSSKQFINLAAIVAACAGGFAGTGRRWNQRHQRSNQRHLQHLGHRRRHQCQHAQR